MSEIRNIEDFENLLDSYEDAAYACGMDGADARDDERKARIGGRVVRAYAALRAENERLSRIEAAARELFCALDYVTPGWREDTLVISERSDEVNVAWCSLDAALAAPPEEK